MSKHRSLRIALAFALFDAISPWMLIFFYLTGIDLLWLVNVNFTLMSLFLMGMSRRLPRLSTLSAILGLALVASLVKFAMVPYYYDNSQELHHYLSYAFGLIMPVAALCFVAGLEECDAEQIHAILSLWARRYAAIAVPGIMLYSFLYFTGHISYFGLGVNFHYIYPFFLNGKIAPVIAFAVIILISGKRAVLINYLLQTFSYFSARIAKQMVSSIMIIGLLGVSLVAIYSFTSLLDRFAWMFEGQYDFSDPYFVLIAGGGRFEELFGIFDYFARKPFEIILGAPPGNFYVLEIFTGDSATKNYSHITFFGLMFRYGIFYSLALYVFFTATIIRHWGSKDPLYLVIIGIVTSSLFGANLVVDPTSWLFLGLFIQLRPRWLP